MLRIFIDFNSLKVDFINFIIRFYELDFIMKSGGSYLPEICMERLFFKTQDRICS